MDIESSPEGRIAIFDAAPTAHDIVRVRGERIGRVQVREGATQGRGASLEWLDELEIWQLFVATPGRPIPAIPQSTARSVRSLTLLGRLKKPLATTDLRSVVGASVDEHHLDGPLSAMTALESLVLGSFTSSGLRPVSGCPKLASLTIEVARGHVIGDFSLRCDQPPPLEELRIDGAGVSSVDGVDGFTRLRDLRVLPRTTKVLDRSIDLRPLAACRDLRWLAIHMNGALVHAEILLQLPRLERVMTVTGKIDPVLEPVPAWLAR